MVFVHVNTCGRAQPASLPDRCALSLPPSMKGNTLLATSSQGKETYRFALDPGYIVLQG